MFRKFKLYILINPINCIVEYIKYLKGKYAPKNK